jgi:hypothetical protein
MGTARRQTWKALCAVASVQAAAACASKGPSPDGTALVKVVGSGGVGVPGAILVSTANGRLIGRAVTGVVGTAELPIVSGGEITGIMERATHDEILTTVLGVRSGTVEIPMEIQVPGDVTVSVLVQSTAGGYANVSGGQCESTVAVTSAVGTVQLARSCVHGDGTFSVSAQKAVIVSFAGEDPTGYAVDVPIGEVAVISLAASTASTVTPVPWAVTNIPSGKDLTVTHWPSHRGLRLGPQDYVYLTHPPSSASGSFDQSSSASADASEMSIDLYDFNTDQQSGLRVRQSGPGPITLDASLIPPFAGVFFDAGNREFAVTDTAAANLLSSTSR